MGLKSLPERRARKTITPRAGSGPPRPLSRVWEAGLPADRRSSGGPAGHAARKRHSAAVAQTPGPVRAAPGDGDR